MELLVKTLALNQLHLMVEALGAQVLGFGGIVNPMGGCQY